MEINSFVGVMTKGPGGQARDWVLDLISGHRRLWTWRDERKRVCEDSSSGAGQSRWEGKGVPAHSGTEERALPQ